MSTIRVNPAACDGFGFCSEILPEMIRRDGWPNRRWPPVPAGLCAWRRPGPGEQGQARRAGEVVR